MPTTRSRLFVADVGAFRLRPSGVHRVLPAFDPVVSLRSTTGYNLAAPPAQKGW